MTRVYLFILTMLIWSCNQNQNSSDESLELEKHEVQVPESSEKMDSISVDTDSLNVVETIYKLTRSQEANIENDSVTLLTGQVFSSLISHKYIRLSNFSGTYIYVYSEKDNYQEPIYSERLGWMNFVSDSIFDINGDKIIDLAIHWYPSSGCCLADIYDCYIYDEKTDQFSEKVEIPNPTFYPKRSLTFSMTYGHPGETEFYEFKWTKNKLDTLSSYEWNGRTHEHIILTDYKLGKKTDLNEIPNKLEVLYGFEWFMMRLKNVEEK